MNLVLISYTPIDAPGGVPRWNRDFKRCFPEAIHYSWWDCPLSKFDDAASEWDRASILNAWLRKFGKISKEDIIIADGYWGRGLEDFPNVISVCHGIWSHLIKEEADASKKPDFPMHHAVQVGYRRSHQGRGGRLVAVSEFISHQMFIQWGFESAVINNAIDLDKFKPWEIKKPHKPLILHGVNDKNNPVKGWDHIEYVKKSIKSHDVLSLDEAYIKYNDSRMTKEMTFSMADLILIPSAFEGNSYFCLEALACDVPIIAYDVGLVYELSNNFSFCKKERYIDTVYKLFGTSLPRSLRSLDETLEGVEFMINPMRKEEIYGYTPRDVAKNYSIERFKQEWKSYLEREFNYGR